MPRNGTPSPRTRADSASVSSCSSSEASVAPGGADAGEDQAFRPADRLRRADQAARQTEVLERVDHTRCVPRSVVDHVDHARPSVVNRLNWTRRCSDDPRGCGSAPHCSSSRRARWRWRDVCRRTARRARPGVPVLGVSRLSAGATRRVLPLARAGEPSVPRPRARRSSSSRRCSSTKAIGTWCGATSRSPSRSSRRDGSTSPTTGSSSPGTTTSGASAPASSCGNGTQFGIALSGVRGADPAAPELRRRQLAHAHASRSSGARALGEHARDRRRTTSITSSPRDTRRSGTAWGTATGPARPTTRPSCCASTTTCSSPAGNQVSARRMSCSSARSPRSGRARWRCANRAARSRRRRAVGFYVLSGDGNVSAYNGAPALGHPNFGSDLARDIAVMPDGNGYVVLTGIGTVHKYGSATDPAGLGDARLPVLAGERPGAIDRDHARRRGLRRAPRRRHRLQVGHRRDGAARRAPEHPVFGSRRRPQHRGHARRRRLPGARPTRRGVEVRHRHAGPDRRREHAVLRHRRRARHRAASAASATTCSTAGAGSGRPSRYPRGGTREACCSPTVGAASRSSAVSPSPSATTESPRPAWADLTIRRSCEPGTRSRPFAPGERLARSARLVAALERAAVAASTGRRRSAAPRRAPSCGTRPPLRRARWSR